MLTWIRQFVAAPSFEGDEDRTRVASLLNTMLLTIFAATVVGSAVMVLVEPAESGFNLIFGAIMAAVVLALWSLMRRGYVQAVGALLSSALWAGITFLGYNGGGVRDPSLTGYFLVIAIASLLLGGRAATIFGLLSVLATLGMLYAEISGAIAAAIRASAGLIELIVLVTTLGLTTLLLRFAGRSIREGFGRARRYAAELEGQREWLEQTVKERTLDLARRARYLAATAEVARDAASVLDLQELLSRTAALVSERFGFYHTGIFLLDPAGEWAVLRAASSEGAQRMLARGHRLRVGQEGIVGYVTAQGQPRIALDVGADAVFFDNPDLPDTRSEMALPLQARGEIIGALDVQSTEPEAFSDEDAAVLQTLADQLAMAISNVRLFQQAQESLEAERQAYGEISREAWGQMARGRPDWGYRCDPQGVHPVESAWRPEMVRARQTGQIVSDGGRTVAMPVKIRDQVVGVVRFRKPSGAGEWTADEVTLVETLTEQLSVALESARLHQGAQRRAARERLIGEITGHVRETLDMETMLKTAVQQMRQALGLPEVVVRLATRPVGEGGGGCEGRTVGSRTGSGA